MTANKNGAFREYIKKMYIYNFCRIKFFIVYIVFL